MFALISDLHANRPALEAVFRAIDSLGIQDVRCLGDVVGYGAEPEPCIDLVMERCEFTLSGNHDQGVVLGQLDDFNPIARESLLWTAKRLKPSFWHPGRRKRWMWLKTLPHRVERDGYLFVHASPRDPIKEYVLKTDGFLDPEKMEDLFSRIQGPCFVGHTHWPGYTDEDFRFHPQSPNQTEFVLPRGVASSTPAVAGSRGTATRVPASSSWMACASSTTASSTISRARRAGFAKPG
jgi:hypothetical protein